MEILKDIILVNEENAIPNDYNVNLVKVINYKNKEILIESQTLNAYLELQKKLLSLGIEIAIIDAYRSVEEQAAKFDFIAERYGIDYAKKFVCKVNHSEHQTGFAVDIVIKNELGEWEEVHNFGLVDKWNIVHQELPNFGFILRYPKDKENITKMPYEPWHIRYVGQIARYIYERDIVLEKFDIRWYKNGCINAKRGGRIGLNSQLGMLIASGEEISQVMENEVNRNEKDFTRK